MRVRQKGDSQDNAQSSSAQGGSSPIGVSENNTAAGTAATGKWSASGTNKKELLKGTQGKTTHLTVLFICMR